MSFHAIIPAGGAGTRLWPLSRKDAPKFLADVTGCGRSLRQQTADRLAPIADAVTVVTGKTHEAKVAEQLPDAAILVEPVARGTMSAIGLAAALVEKGDPEAIVGSFAADHLIADSEAFVRAVRAAIGAAQEGYVVTIGITPDHPSTAYGYIRAGEGLGEGDGPSEGVRAVRSFVEKPDEPTAAEYLASGDYLWNAGMFIAKAGVLMGALERFHPETAGPLRELAARWDSEREEAIEELWMPLAPSVIDTAIAEPLAGEGGVAVVPVEMGWSDVGDYASLAEVIDESKLTSQVAPGGTMQQVLAIDSPDSLVYTGSKPIVVVGIPHAVVVDAGDVLMVSTRENAQAVKTAVENLSKLGLSGLA